MPKLLIHPFEAIVGERPKILILGSFPSVGSVNNGGYYGHSTNVFWKILADVLGRDDLRVENFWNGDDWPGIESAIRRGWERRYRLLREDSIALWDVARRVDREGNSSDASLSNVVANNVIDLLVHEKTIRTILFSGKTAAKLYSDLVRWRLIAFYPNRASEINLVVCPSTSGAHAIPYRKKLVAWRRAIREGLSR